MNIQSDQELITSVRHGSRKALEDIYVQNYPMVKDYILKNSGTELDAKDIYQDGMIILHEKLSDPTFLLTAKISSFLFSICKNLWLKHLRSIKKMPKSELNEDTDFIPDMVDDFREKEVRLHSTLKAIEQLGKSCQRILEMFFFEKSSMTEIANELGYTNEANAKNQKYKCMKKLKAKLL